MSSGTGDDSASTSAPPRAVTPPSTGCSGGATSPYSGRGAYIELQVDRPGDADRPGAARRRPRRRRARDHVRCGPTASASVSVDRARRGRERRLEHQRVVDVAPARLDRGPVGGRIDQCPAASSRMRPNTDGRRSGGSTASRSSRRGSRAPPSGSRTAARSRRWAVGSRRWPRRDRCAARAGAAPRRSGRRAPAASTRAGRPAPRCRGARWRPLRGPREPMTMRSTSLCLRVGHDLVGGRAPEQDGGGAHAVLGGERRRRGAARGRARWARAATRRRTSSSPSGATTRGSARRARRVSSASVRTRSRSRSRWRRRRRGIRRWRRGSASSGASARGRTGHFGAAHVGLRGLAPAFIPRCRRRGSPGRRGYVRRGDGGPTTAATAFHWPCSATPSNRPRLE